MKGQFNFRVEQQLLDECRNVLGSNESLSQFITNAMRDELTRRKIEKEIEKIPV